MKSKPSSWKPLSAHINAMLQVKIANSTLKPEEKSDRLLYISLLDHALDDLNHHSSSQYIIGHQPFSHYRNYLSDPALEHIQTYMHEHNVDVKLEKLSEINGFDNGRTEVLLELVLDNIEGLIKKLDGFQADQTNNELDSWFTYSLLIFALAKWVKILKQYGHENPPAFFINVLLQRKSAPDQYYNQIKKQFDEHILKYVRAAGENIAFFHSLLEKFGTVQFLYKFSFTILALASNQDKESKQVFEKVLPIASSLLNSIFAEEENELSDRKLLSLCRIGMSMNKACLQHGIQPLEEVAIIVRKVEATIERPDISTETLVNMVYLLYTDDKTKHGVMLEKLAMRIRKNVVMTHDGKWAWSANPETNDVDEIATAYAVAVLCFLSSPPDLPLIEQGATLLLDFLLKESSDTDMVAMALCSLVDFILFAFVAKEREMGRWLSSEPATY